MKFPALIRMMTIAGLAIALASVGGPAPAAAPATGLAAGEVSATPSGTATFNGAVRAIAYAGRTIYVGGEFTTAFVGGRVYPRLRLAAVDAITGALLPWSPSADARVRGLAAADGAVFAVGEFGRVNGVRRDSLVRLDGASGAVHPAFRHSIAGQPITVAAGHGRLYLGGTVSAVDGQPRGRLAAFALATGALDPSWWPVADDRVESLAVTADRIYIGGTFRTLNGVAGTAKLAAVDPASGVGDPGFRPRVDVVAHAIAAGPGGVFAALGGQGGRVTSYDPGGAARWTLTTDGDVQAVAVLGDLVYLGGHFDNVCRSARTGDKGLCQDGSDPRVKVAAVDLAAGRLAAWAPQANGIEGVFALAAGSGVGVAAGGTFTTIGGAPQLRFALFR